MPFDFLWVIGQELDVIQFEDAIWIFHFRNGGEIRVECPWRLIVGGHIVISSSDHGQQYGQQSPVDAEARCRSELLGRKVLSFEVRDDTRDILLFFLPGTRLDILPISSGHESWEIATPSGVQIVAQGGGDLVKLE